MQENSLYKLTAEFLEAIGNLQVCEETGEILNFDTLDELNMAIDAKVESVACHIKNQAALASSVKSEEDALAKRRKAIDSNVKRLQEYLVFAMDAMGKEKFETAKCRVSFLKSSKVNIDDESILPKDFIRQTIKEEPDKTAIKEAIAAGEVVAGASIVTGRNIQIK